MVSAEGDPMAQAEVLCRAVDGGADVVQLRNKAALKRDLLLAALVVAAYARQSDALFIVNDHLDVAMAATADGVHLGQDDLPLRAARRVWGPGHLVGCSTHSLEQALAAESAGADYIGIGPVYATPTKPGRPAVGLELVRAAAAISIPWFAIGGLDTATLPGVIAAGGSRVAVVRAVASAADPRRAARELRELLDYCDQTAEVAG
ncbi:MAG: thiamine phosphate synthase [Candidatus Dormibacteria bacterium]